jgi:hypothetical protein
MPEKFITQLRYANVGFWPNASVLGVLSQYGITLSNLVAPLNVTGANWVAWQNPVGVLGGASAEQATGLKNLLYNSVTGTGFYTSYRVRGVSVKISIFPETSLDNLNTVYAPLAGTTGFTLGGTTTIANSQDAPFAQYKICNQISMNGGIKTMYFRNHEIRGQSLRQFNDDPGNVGTYASAPANAITLSTLLQTQDQGNTVSSVGWNIQLCYDVEFFQPISQFLLD